MANLQNATIGINTSDQSTILRNTTPFCLKLGTSTSSLKLFLSIFLNHNIFVLDGENFFLIFFIFNLDLDLESWNTYYFWGGGVKETLFSFFCKTYSLSINH